jgi:hypothetical protein
LRGDTVEMHTGAGSHRQRVIPTRSHLEALVGTWELSGEMVQMMEEPNTGVLMALSCRGDWINPMTVISRGSKR